MSKKPRNRNKLGSMFFTFFLGYLFALGFPLIAKVLLQSNLSLILIVLLVIIKPSLTILGELTPKNIKRVCIIVSSIFSFVFAFFITIGILITPANSYRLLFKAMQANILNPGRVVNIFVLFLAFFSTSFSCIVIKKDYAGPLLGMGLIISLLSALIFQSPIIYIISLLFILGCLMYLGRRYLDKGNRLGNVIFSVIIIIFCLGLGYGLHRLLGINRSRAIDRTSASIRGVVAKLFPQIPLIYELPEFGFSFEDEFENDLGSTPILSNITLFEVEGNSDQRNIYLKTRVHDQFINNHWETPTYNIYFENEMEKNKKIGITPEEEDVVADVLIPYVEGVEKKGENEIAIRLFGEYFNFLPYTLDTVEFRFRKNPPKVAFGDFKKGFYLDNMDMLLSGDIIYLREEKRLSSKPDSFNPYLQIPSALSPQIRGMARKYESIMSPRAKIAAIKQDLAFNYTYNIDTGTIKENENFLDAFLLKTKEGYSVHFATAFIMLARLNDIPARYATGFLAFFPKPVPGQIFFGGFKTTISGLSTHVWPEVWYPDTGWTTEEATPAVNPDFYTITNRGIVFNKNITLNSRTQQQISAIMGEPVVSEDALKSFSFGNMNINLFYVLYGIIPIVVSLLFFRYAHLFVYLFRKNRKTVNMLLKKTIKKHMKNGLPIPENVGWLEWGIYIKENSPQSTPLIDNCTHIILDIMYGDVKVKKSDVKAFFSLYRKVKSRKIKEPIKAE